MSNLHAVQDEFRNRLNAQVASQNPVEPVAGAGIPAHSVPNAAPPPIQQPAAAVPSPSQTVAAPVAPTVPAQPVVTVETLQAELGRLQASNEALNAQVMALRTQPPPMPVQIALPPKEILDAMPQSELAALLVQHQQQTAGHTMAAAQSMVGALEQQRIAPLAANLNAVRKVEAEKALRSRFPRLDMEKYRPAFEAKLIQNRSLSFEDAIRLVADPADLMPGDPAPTSVTGHAVHMESGVPVRASAQPAPASKGPSREQLIASAEEARRRGDTFEHGRLMKQATALALGFTTG